MSEGVDVRKYRQVSFILSAFSVFFCSRVGSHAGNNTSEGIGTHNTGHGMEQDLQL